MDGRADGRCCLSESDGRANALPPYARQMGQVILGSAVSLYFTPPVVAALGGNLPAIAAATVVVFLVGIFGALTLSRASGVDANDSVLGFRSIE